MSDDFLTRFSRFKYFLFKWFCLLFLVTHILQHCSRVLLTGCCLSILIDMVSVTSDISPTTAFGKYQLIESGRMSCREIWIAIFSLMVSTKERMAEFSAPLFCIHLGHFGEMRSNNDRWSVNSHLWLVWFWVRWAPWLCFCWTLLKSEWHGVV
jgi:hypothetical protein